MNKVNCNNNNRRQDKIYQNSKQKDRWRRRYNDVTRSFIANLIKDGCKYCGSTSNKMTLDRIDNSLGHTKLNVVPACQTCNNTRGHLPYGIWLLIQFMI